MAGVAAAPPGTATADDAPPGVTAAEAAAAHGIHTARGGACGGVGGFPREGWAVAAATAAAMRAGATAARAGAHTPRARRGAAATCRVHTSWRRVHRHWSHYSSVRGGGKGTGRRRWLGVRHPESADALGCIRGDGKINIKNTVKCSL